MIWIPHTVFSTIWQLFSFLAFVLYGHHFSDNREFLGTTDLAILLSEMYTIKKNHQVKHSPEKTFFYVFWLTE